MKLINCWSTTSNKSSVTDPGDIVVIYNKDKEKKMKIVKNFKWYFYTEVSPEARKCLDHLKKEIRDGFNLVQDYKEGKKYIKVYSPKRYYKDRMSMEVLNYLKDNNVKTYEGDVGPSKRFILDNNLELEDFENINVLYFDIETDDSNGTIEYETFGGYTQIKAKDRILSFAGVTKEGKEFFLHHADEKELLNSINKLIEEESIDMLVGWNSKEFDIPYIYKRMEKYKINSTIIRNILHEDLMKRVQYFYAKDPEARQKITSYSLNSISKYFLNESKIEREGKVIDLMKSDFETFKEYNIQDCRLVRNLENKLGLINLTYQMFQMCQCTAQDWTMVKALDNFILSEGNKIGVHYPTNESYIERKEEDDSQYLGAFVLDPIPGYYEDVYDLDFKSLYPNIIRTFNISPDTRVKKISGLDQIETPGVEDEGVIKGKCYFDDIQGVIPKKIKLLLDERDKIRTQQKKFSKDSVEWRDLNVKQLVVKELANSIYGIIGNKYFRSFSVDLAESITCTGQYLIKWLQSYFNGDNDRRKKPASSESNTKHGNGSTVSESVPSNERKAIYGDTDSIFVTLKDNESIGEVLRKVNSDLEHHIKREFHVKDYSLDLDLDKVFDKFLIISKKKYVGLADGKMKYVGMECIKRDNVELASEYQRAVINNIFNGKHQGDMKNIITRMKAEVLEGTLPIDKITISKKMGKDAHLYKGKEGGKKYTPPIQVRIVKEMKFKKGDKTDLSKGGSIIQFIYTKGSTDGVHLSEFKGEYDREHYWNKLIYPQLERILKVVYPDVPWVEYYKTNLKKPIYADRKRVKPISVRKRKTDSDSTS